MVLENLQFQRLLMHLLNYGIHFGVGAFPLCCYNTIVCEMFQEISVILSLC